MSIKLTGIPDIINIKMLKKEGIGINLNKMKTVPYIKLDILRSLIDDNSCIW